MVFGLAVCVSFSLFLLHLEDQMTRQSEDFDEEAGPHNFNGPLKGPDVV